MRILRIVFLALFGALAVVVGLLVAAMVGLAGMLARALGGKRSSPRQAAPCQAVPADVIDVTATEVRDK